MDTAIPTIEIAQYRDAQSVWSPDAKYGSSYVIQGGLMAAHVLIQLVICAEIKEILVSFLKLGQKTIRIVDCLYNTAVVVNFKLVIIWPERGIAECRASQNNLEDTFIADTLHAEMISACQKLDISSMGLESTNNSSIARLPGEMYTKNLKRIIMSCLDNSVELLVNGHGNER